VLSAHLAQPQRDFSLAKGTGKSPLHVLTLTPFFPSAGDEVSGCFVAESLEQLKQSGIESTVIAVTPIHYVRKYPSPAAPAEWVRYAQLPGNFGLSRAGKFLYSRLMGKVPKLHAVKPIDVIHAHAALPCGHAAALLSKKMKIPFVVTLHGLDVFNTCFLGGIPAEWRRQVSVDVYRAAKTVICISGKVQEILKTGMPRATSSTIVYNGTNAAFFSSALGESEQQELEILTIGNLIPSKGHELVLQAFERIRSSFPQLRCRVIGDGPDRARLESLTRDLGIGDRVQFVGRQSRADVAEAMRRCSIFALPSRYEGLGCVYLEAMSCAKPVIACRGQGIDEVIEHGRNGWLVPPDGLEELVQGLLALLGSPELRAHIGTAARQTILNKLTLSHQSEQLATIYTQAIA
jgi:teichuronic acid biosynthesis glycosyltransferase TuaC